MVQVIEQQDIWEQAGAGLGAGLTAGLQEKYQQYQKQKQQQAENAEVDRLFEEAGGMDADPMDQMKAIMKMPVSDATKQMYVQGLMQQQKQQSAERQSMMEEMSFQSLFAKPPSPEASVEDLDANVMSAEQMAEQEMPVEPVDKAVQSNVENKLLKAKSPLNKNPISMPEKVEEKLDNGEIGYEDLNNAQLAGLSRSKPKAYKALFDKYTQDVQKFDKSIDRQMPYINDVGKRARGAYNALNILDQMERYEDSGKIDHPLLVKFYDTVGLNFRLSPETQGFKNLVLQFTKDIKNYYGARISAFELDTFIKAIPSLQNSPDGRRAIYKVMRVLEKGKVLKSDLVDKSVQEAEKNGTPLSATFQMQMDRMAEHQKGAMGQLGNNAIQDALKQAVSMGAIGEDWESGRSEYDSQYGTMMGETESSAPAGTIAIKAPDGRILDVPEEEVGKFLEMGGTRI